jgi:hypothetical protein
MQTVLLVVRSGGLESCKKEDSYIMGGVCLIECKNMTVTRVYHIACNERTLP